jgi:DNA-binding NarL/FixJ family response regulator
MAFVLMVDADNRAALEASISRIPGASLYMVGSEQCDGCEPVHARPSGRLAQILPLVVAGSTNKEIGRHLGISHFTVRNHVARLLRLYGARNRAELLAMLGCRSFRV